MRKTNKSPKEAGLSRRRFLKGAALAVAAPTVIPGSALGADGAVAPSNRIAMGGIGQVEKDVLHPTNGLQLGNQRTDIVVFNVGFIVRINAPAHPPRPRHPVRLWNLSFS